MPHVKYPFLNASILLTASRRTSILGFHIWAWALTHSSILMNAPCKTPISGPATWAHAENASSLVKLIHLQNKICWVRSRLHPCHPRLVAFFWLQTAEASSGPNEILKTDPPKKKPEALQLKVTKVSADPVL